MTSTALRTTLLLATVVVAGLGISCAKRRVVQAPAEPAAQIVLLPDPDDNTVGRATVSNGAGRVELDGAYQTTRVVANRPPTPATTMDRTDVDRMFHDVLASLPPPPRHFTLYFQFGTDDLTPESRALVPDVLQVVRARPTPDVIVVGHTDTTGTSPSNYDLGLRRATVVRDLLVAAGLEASVVEVTSHGEGDPLVTTRDETYEPRNRRVEIDIL